MPDYLIWPVLITLTCSGFLLGVRIEKRRWRQRCNDALMAVEAKKGKADGK